MSKGLSWFIEFAGFAASSLVGAYFLHHGGWWDFAAWCGALLLILFGAMLMADRTAGR